MRGIKISKRTKHATDGYRQGCKDTCLGSGTNSPESHRHCDVRAARDVGYRWLQKRALCLHGEEPSKSLKYRNTPFTFKFSNVVEVVTRVLGIC